MCAESELLMLKDIAYRFLKWCQRPRTNAWAQLTDIVVEARTEAETQAVIESAFAELRAA